MAEVKKGLDLLVYINDDTDNPVCVGFQKDCTLSMSADSIDTSNKNDFGWQSFIQGGKSWEITCSGQFVTDDAGQKLMTQAFVNGDFVHIAIQDRDDESYKFEGDAMISGLELSASFDDVFAYDATFAGKGALTIPA